MTRAPGPRNRELLDWYRIHRRDLPWRDCGDPYAVLVSEFMLQQTQAERVIPYFRRFMQRFPRLGDLAAAELADVLALWSGLGYNSRAKRLRDAARIVDATGWPADLTDLPGVGPYTAAAIACFGFGRTVATVDTNHRRVLSRWSGNALSGVSLQRAAEEAMADAPAAEWNQAVMDLGAMVCRPRRPRCGSCPVQEWCADPGVYRPPPSQGTFAGSDREARGAVLRAVLSGPVPERRLAAVSGLEPARAVAAVDRLLAEGLVEGPPYRPSS